MRQRDIADLVSHTSNLCLANLSHLLWLTGVSARSLVNRFFIVS